MKYQIIQKGNGKFFVNFVGKKSSYMTGSDYFDTKEAAMNFLKQTVEKRKEYERLNKQTVVYEETI